MPMNWQRFLVRKWLIRALLLWRGVRDIESNGKIIVFVYISPETIHKLNTVERGPTNFF